MKINIRYTSIKHYSIKNINQWLFTFKKYKYVKGFILRLFGVYFNVLEKNAQKKLLALATPEN